jgi:hypothetical protein
MTLHRGVTSFLGMATILLALTACDTAGGGPEASTTSTPPASALPSGAPSEGPSPDPVSHPASVIVDGDSVSVTASEGGILIDIPFATDPTLAVSQLNEALGLVGTVSTIPSSPGCFAERQQATWGGLKFSWGDDWQRAPGAKFMAVAEGAVTTNGLKVTLPTGQWIGWDGAEVIAANPSAPYSDNGTWGDLFYDVASGSATGNPDEYYGAYALIRDGALQSFVSPIHYYYDC